MNIKNFIHILLFLCIASIAIKENLVAVSLDGTSSPIYKNQHHVFSDGNYAQGFVRMNGGFTIKPGAKATLDTVISVSGSIDLRETGIMQLLSNLNLDSRISWSNGGYINGRGNAIILNDQLTIPASKIIHIIGDTIIDGCDKQTILLKEHARIFVENNATLTLRNIIIKNTRNNQLAPCIQVTGARSKLALDNAELAITGDMFFARGQLYAHNNVVFTGTSSFIYTSVAQSYVAPFSTLTFDLGTTFSFAPSSTEQDLFILQDKTSTLYLNGCTLKTTSSGMRLTRGNLIFDNKVTVETNAGGGVLLTELSAITSKDYGGDIETMSWHPSGTILAVGGDGPVAVGPFPAGNELHVYSFNGTTLTPFTSRNFCTGNLETMAWHPSGNVLAIGGDSPTSTTEFPNNDEVRLYKFNGSTLTALTSVDYGSRARDVSWNPLGTILNVGGQTPAAVGGFGTSDDLRLYKFDGSTLTALVGKRYGLAIFFSTWNPAGNVLAIGGMAPVSTVEFPNTHSVRLYSFNGSTLTALTSKPYTTTGYPTACQVCAWNPDGTVLAIGGNGASNIPGDFENTHDVRLYSFDGSTLTKLTSVPYSNGAGYVGILQWNSDGSILAIGGQNPTNAQEVQLFRFDGTTLTETFSLNYGDPLSDGEVVAINWNPQGNVLAIGGGSPQSGNGTGFINTDELRLYGAGFNQVGETSSPQALSRSLVFGNSALGSDYNLDVKVLGGSYVKIDGKIVDDSA